MYIYQFVIGKSYLINRNSFKRVHRNANQLIIFQMNYWYFWGSFKYLSFNGMHTNSIHVQTFVNSNILESLKK